MTKLQNCSQKFQELLHHIKNEIFYIFVGTPDESGFMSGPNGRSIWIIFFEIFWNPKMYKNGIFRIEIFYGSRLLIFRNTDFLHSFIPAGTADEFESLIMDHWTLRYDQSYDHPELSLMGFKIIWCSLDQSFKRIWTKNLL